VSYIYFKKDPPKKSALSRHKKTIVSILAITGLSLFSFAAFPILNFQLTYSSKLQQIIDPLSGKSYNHSAVLGENNVDYTQLSNWFVNSPDNLNTISQTIDNNNSTYYLSIPKLKITDSIVTIGSMDLTKSLIQYPQTALPGQLGNTVVFGHSVLPQFFSPKNYLTIFSTLYKLEQGDEIILRFDKSTYKYVVEEMYEIKPTDLSVLEQHYDNKTLTLITCSPPGTYIRRLIVKAVLAIN
jgi:sortase A